MDDEMVTPTKGAAACAGRVAGPAATTADAGGGDAGANKRKVETSPPFRSARREVGEASPRADAKGSQRRQQGSPRGQRRLVDVGRLTREVCRTLNEPKLPLMRRAIDTLGIPAVEALVARVREVEEQGGQMTADGDRRRTPGGVFWKLLKQSVGEQEYATIFEVERERERARARRRQARRNAARLLGEGGAAGGPAPGAPCCASPSSGSDRSADADSSIDGCSEGAPAAPALGAGGAAPPAAGPGAFAARGESTDGSDDASNVDSQHDRLADAATSEEGDRAGAPRAPKGARASDASLRLVTPEKVTDEVKELLTKDWVMVLGQSPKASPSPSMASKAGSEAAGTPMAEDAPAAAPAAAPQRAKKKSGAMKVALAAAAETPRGRPAAAGADSPPRVTVEESRRTKRVTMDPDASMEALKKKLSFADILSSP